ncbi:hypothetical protein [Cytobacillus gottheilii]|uniref:hypothetical protein n=1 Tax=Cytobacillus gottheilii TaxID=859144 RepID=UPI003CD0CB50
MQHEMHVYLVVFDQQSFGLSQKLFHSIQEYIDEYYVEEASALYGGREARIVTEQLREQDYVKQSEDIEEAV